MSVLAALLPQVAAAQTAVVMDPIAVTATEVAPGGVQIDAQTIEDANPTSIKDVFDGEASVNAGGGSDVSRKTYVNGIEDTNLNVKIDGARQVNSAFHHLGTAIIDPGLLKSVRIETGVGPADVGAGALGGSIAYETKDARDILKTGESLGGFLKASYETNGATKRGIFTSAHRAGAFEGLLYGSYENGSSYENGNGDVQDGTAPKMNNFIGKGAWSSIDGHRVELDTGYLNDAGIRPNRANFGSLANGAPPSHQAFKRQLVSVSYRDETPTDMVNPEAVLSYNKSALSVDGLAFGANRFHIASTTTSYSGKLANTFATGLGLVDSGNVTAGVDFYHDTGFGSRSGGFSSGEPLENEETSLNVGLFVQARMPITDAFRVSFGGRYDRQWFEGIDDTEIDEDGFSGNLNLEHDIASGITGYAGIGTTFGPIPLGESAIYDFSANWTYDGLHNSRSRNTKIGIKADQGPFSGDIHVYMNKIYGAHARGNADRSSTSEIESNGLNLSGAYRYGDGHIRATFSHNEVRSDDAVLASGSSSFLGLQMGDIFTVSAVHEFPDTGVKLGASVERAFRDNDNPSAPRPGYFVADIFTQWTPPGYEFVELRFDVLNLLDHSYVSRATAGDVDTSAANAFLEPGRSLMVTATMKF